MEKEQKVELGSIVKGEIELPTFDAKQYIGTDATIEIVQEMSGEYGYFVRLESSVITELKGKDDKVFEIRATKHLGLQQDEEGNVGWGVDTKMGNFLKVMGVKHYRELQGKPVKVQTLVKDGKEWLTF